MEYRYAFYLPNFEFLHVYNNLLYISWIIQIQYNFFKIIETEYYIKYP